MKTHNVLNKRLWLVWTLIFVFKLAAVLNASLSVFQMTLEISSINGMGQEGDFVTSHLCMREM